MEKKTLSQLNAALILFLFLVVLTLVINFGGFLGNFSLGYISWAIVVVGILLLVMKYARDMDGRVSFGNLFAYGFKTTAFLILFFIAFTVVFYLVFPEYKARLIELMKENVMKKATPENREQIEKALEFVKNFFWVQTIAGILILFAILGSLGSVLGAAFSKKNSNPLADNPN